MDGRHGRQRRVRQEEKQKCVIQHHRQVGLTHFLPVCCIYHKPRAFDESSSESSAASENDEESELNISSSDDDNDLTGTGGGSSGEGNRNMSSPYPQNHHPYCPHNRKRPPLRNAYERA